MLGNTEDSETSVLRKLFAALKSVQKKLDSFSHGDEYLRYRLLNPVDIPHIQDKLRGKMPRSTQQGAHRIANHLSDKPRSDRSVAIHYTGVCIQTIRIAGMRRTTYGRRIGTRKRNLDPILNRGRRTFSDPDHWKMLQGRKIRSSRWKGVKRCFVCRKNHMANDGRPREQVGAAIQKLSSKNPTALLSLDDDAVAIDQLCNDGQDDIGVEDEV